MELVTPSAAYLQQYLETCRECWGKIHDNYILHDPARYNEWRKTIFTDYKNAETGTEVPYGFVPSSTYWLTDSDTLLGVLNIRKQLSPALRNYGGTFGYFIRLSQQHRGYGCTMAMLGLEKARKMGLSEIILTCQAANTASYRLLQKMPYIRSEKENILLYGIQQDIYRFYF